MLTGAAAVHRHRRPRRCWPPRSLQPPNRSTRSAAGHPARARRGSSGAAWSAIRRPVAQRGGGALRPRAGRGDPDPRRDAGDTASRSPRRTLVRARGHRGGWPCCAGRPRSGRGPGAGAQRVRWAHEQAIPQLLALADRGEWDSTYALARRVEAVNPERLPVPRPETEVRPPGESAHQSARRGGLAPALPGTGQRLGLAWARHPSTASLLPLGASRPAARATGSTGALSGDRCGFAGLQMSRRHHSDGPRHALPSDMVRITGRRPWGLLPGLRARETGPARRLSPRTASKSPTPSSSGSWTAAATGAASSGRHPFLRQGGRLTWGRRWS